MVGGLGKCDAFDLKLMIEEYEGFMPRGRGCIVHDVLCFRFSALIKLLVFSAFRLSAFRVVDKSNYQLARPFYSDLKPCLTMGKPEVKLTFN